MERDCDLLSSSEWLLQCTDLSAGYSSVVTGKVSFRLASGEVLGIRGQNGAGKSTLLRAIAGSARLFSGSLNRAPETEVLHHQQNWETGTELPLTGKDLCHLTGASLDAAPERIRLLLGKRLDQLSGGQGQLVRLWACLDSTAALLLLDEPTNSLDTSAIELLTTMILKTSPERGMIVVSHEAQFLDAVCSRSITLE